MTTSLETAFPLNANWPAANVRSKLAEAMIGVFDTPDLSGEDFTIQPYRTIAVFGPDGDLTFYAYDAGDTVTADDGGVSCIVVSGRRYKRSGEMAVKDAAISATTDDQPVSPSLGDTYIVPAAPSGDDWAGEAKTVAMFTARGWLFRQPFVGMMVYVEDEDAIYHYSSAGDWVAGLPVGALPDGSIPPKKLENPFAVLKVQDQRNDPPGSSPSAGTMYLVGISPTGDFVGHKREVARWTGTMYQFIAPSEGDTIYRVDQGSLFTYRSGAWAATISQPVVVQSYYVNDVTVNTSSGSLTNRLSSPSIVAQVGQKLRVTVQFLGIESVTTPGTAGIRIDTTGSLARAILAIPMGASVRGVAFAEIDVPDGLPHVYHIATTADAGGSVLNVTSRATFEVIQPST